MAYIVPDWDATIDRRHSDSIKWTHYPEDVLPLWVADADFPSPEPVLQALQRRVAHGVFGYGAAPRDLIMLLVERLHRLYAWEVSPESLVLLSGVVAGVNMACRAFASSGEGVLVQPPVYPPILHAHRHANLANQQAPLARQADGRYLVDLEAFRRTIDDRSRLFILCNPHNPVGRVFTRAELEAMARICLEHGMLICSDEIHCDLIYSGQRHVPIASLDPEIAARTVTLMAPSKTFNIAGLQCAFAVIPDEEMRRRFRAAGAGLVQAPNVLALVAAEAAYRSGQEWLAALLAYLQDNRDHTARRVQQSLPGIRMVPPEGTYLAWLDCRDAKLPSSPYQFFLQEAKVALGDGHSFGSGGEDYVRLNFACPRPILDQALDRMAAALARVAHNKTAD
ncbi:MAG: MalY/PatB family protein [Anaerolineae bacterium]